MYRIGAVHIAWLPDMFSIRTSSLLLLCSSLSGTVVLTSTVNTTLSSPGVKTVCRKTDVWIAPQWPDTIGLNCREIIQRFETLEPESRQAMSPLHDFLPLGLSPQSPTPEPVRSPWKLTNGTNFFLFLFPPSSHGSSSVQCHVKYSLKTLAA